MKNMSIRNKDSIILMGCVVVMHFLFWNTADTLFLASDSVGYIEYNIIDYFPNGRTPVYPLFIAINKILFGDNFLRMIFWGQEIICLVSIYFLWLTLNLVSPQKKINKILVFMYGTSYAVIGWNGTILTESLAISGCVFYMYFMIRFMKELDDRIGAATVGICLILTFLRPTYLLFLVVSIVFIIIFSVCKGNYKTLKLTYWIIAISIIFVIIYSTLFYMEYGMFTISDPLPRQLLYVVMERGYYNNSSNLEFVNSVNQAINQYSGDLWKAMTAVLIEFGLVDGLDLAKESMMNSFRQYVRDEVLLAFYTSRESFNAYYTIKGDVNYILRQLNEVWGALFNIWKPVHAIILAIISLGIWIKEIVKKKIDWLFLGCGAYVVLIFVTTLVATCGEYMRTMIHMLPIFYLNMCLLLNYLINEKEDFFWITKIETSKNNK